MHLHLTAANIAHRVYKLQTSKAYIMYSNNNINVVVVVDVGAGCEDDAMKCHYVFFRKAEETTYVHNNM